MSDAERQALGREILKRVSRSFYLSLVVLPKLMREPLSLGYLLARTSDTIADAGSLPADERRDLLESFRHAVARLKPELADEVRSRLRSQAGLSDPGERELIERMPDCLEWLGDLGDESLRSSVVDVLEVITDGQLWDIERFEMGHDAGGSRLHFCETAGELDKDTYQVAGCVGEFWTRVGYQSGGDFADSAARSDLLNAGKRYGQGLQLVNILRDLGEDLGNGRCYLPRDELMAAGWRDGKAWGYGENREAVLQVAGRWRETARDYLAQGEAYAARLRAWRVRMATRLPARLGLRTLDLLDAAGGVALEQRVKISRAVVWRELFGSLFASKQSD